MHNTMHTTPLTLGVLQLYSAIRHNCAWCRKSLLFWSTALCTTFRTAASACGCIWNSGAVQYVLARSSRKRSCAILILLEGVWAASHNMLNGLHNIIWKMLRAKGKTTRATYRKTWCNLSSDGKYSCTSCRVFQILLCIDTSKSVPSLLNSRVSSMKSQSCR